MNRRSFLASTGLLLASLSLGAAPPSDPNVRTVEVLQGRAWVPIQWADLKRGMIFRLRDPDGSIVDKGQDHEVSLAMADATLTPWQGRKGAHSDPFEVGATWGVRCEPLAAIDLNTLLAARIKIFDKDGNPLGFVYRLHVPTMLALVPDDWGGDDIPDRQLYGFRLRLVTVGRIEIDLPKQDV